MFSGLIEILKTEGNGIHGFQKCPTSALELAAKDPEMATPYLLLGVTAEQFVNLYEGQPLPTRVAEEELQRFEDYAAKLSRAYSTKAADQKMAIIDDVAARIADTKRA